MVKDADCAVIGLGALGSQILWRLAKRNIRAVGFEQYAIGHEYGSSHGNTRLFRTACAEHVGLAPLAQLSASLVRELERKTDTPLLELTGGVMIGERAGTLVSSTRAAVDAWGLDYDELSADEIRDRYPGHSTVGTDDVGIWDPGAGIIRPEATVRAARQAAASAGAAVFEKTSVEEITFNDAYVEVRTPTRTFNVDSVVVATGPWMARLLPDLKTQAVRVPQLWFPCLDNSTTGEFNLDRFPVFMREVSPSDRIWGHGRWQGSGVKLGPWGDPTRDRTVDADGVDRAVSPVDWRYVGGLIARWLPGLSATPSRTIICMTTSTPDGQFVVGKAADRLVVAGGGNGHGFKHCAGIGEVIACLVGDEEPPLDTAFMDPKRW